MYGASITKAAFASMVLQLVDEGVIELDTSIAHYLPRPLPTYRGEANLYAPWDDLGDDERWRDLTPRLLLTHSSGFGNFAFLEPDGKLRFHFDPGSRYAYSGEGYILLQFVLERGLGLDVGKEIRDRVFDPLGMSRTDMMWREDFAEELADGWTANGQPVPHDERSKVRAAGSMDTTIADAARLAAALVTCRRLSEQSCRELSSPSLPITTAAQFPTLQDELPKGERRPDLAAVRRTAGTRLQQGRPQ
jgi:CubicO group peptidase (beta-lactamase class C family)